MAQEEIIFKVGVDTGDSKTKVDNVGNAFDDVNKKVELTGRSFKELQDELKKVTQELQNLNPTSKEFENLTKKANELKREMKAVGDSMNETNNDTNKSFTSLRKELKDLTIQLQNLDPASKEFEKVAQRAGQIKEQMRGVADAINDADPEVFGGKFQRTAEGIAGAFSAVTGAQALFGNSSEELEKQMLKVQGAIALTQGISAMKELKNDALDLALSIRNNVVKAFTSLTTAEMVNAEATGTMTALQKAYAFAVGTSTGAMKVFRIALAATGIGLAVVAITFLIEKIASFVSNTDAATLAQDKFNASVDRYNKQQEKTRKNVEDSIQYQLDYAKAVGMSEEGQYKLQKEGYEKRERLRKEELDNNKTHLAYLKIQRDSALEDENTELVKSINEQITKTKEANNNLIGEKYKLIQEQSLLTANYNRTQKEEQQKANDEASAKRKENNAKIKAEQEREAQERINLQRKLEDLTVANIDDVNTREIMALKLKHDREREELIKQYEGKKGLKEKYDALMLELDVQQENERSELKKQQDDAQTEKDKAKKEKENLDKRSQLEAEIIRAEEDFNLKQQKRIELENLDYEQKKANTELTNGELELLKAQHESNINAINDESAERQKQTDLALQESKKELMNAVGSIFGELAGMSKQASAVQKAFAITQVAIDTATALSGLTSISFSPTNGDNIVNPLGPYIKLATGTAKIIANMSRVKSILGSGVSVQPPTVGGPNANLGVGANNGTQGTQTNVQAQSTYKVVVVDSDITKMQEKTKKTELISTI